MKKIAFYLVCLSVFFACLEAATASKTQEKYQIIKRNHIDNTDVYAIQLDDSETEDEEEINEANRQQTFPPPVPK